MTTQLLPTPTREAYRRPPLFCEDNRIVWEMVRRFMIFFLKELDKAYGWKTFEK